jgi:hypothetical protein
MATSRRANHNASNVPPRRSPCNLPIIGLSALLQLAEWSQSRRERDQQGGLPCPPFALEMSPPAPRTADGATPDQPALARSAGRRTAEDLAGTEPGRGPTARRASEPWGGVA